MVTTTGEREIANDQVDEQHKALWGALAANAELLGTSPGQRPQLLRDRARLWDELATISSPACEQAYRDAAAKCRAESDQSAASMHSPN
jgi:hypothetical protein